MELVLLNAKMSVFSLFRFSFLVTWVQPYFKRKSSPMRINLPESVTSSVWLNKELHAPLTFCTFSSTAASSHSSCPGFGSWLMVKVQATDFYNSQLSLQGAMGPLREDNTTLMPASGLYEWPQWRCENSSAAYCKGSMIHEKALM